MLHPAASPSRRRLQFSLGTLLIAVTVASCGLGWIGRERSSAAEARAALAAFEKGPCMSHREPASSKWRDWIVGDDPGRNLTFLCVEGQKIGDDDLQHVGALKSLKAFRLSATKISDVSLARLQGLKHLESLRIQRTRVTAEGVAKLQAALPKCVIHSSFGDPDED